MKTAPKFIQEWHPKEAHRTCSPSSLRTGEDGRTYLTFRPQGYANPIDLPVITSGSRDKTGAWTWNGSLDKPTLRPSVKSWHPDGTISHLWLNEGMCEYLSDSTDGLAGLSLPLFLLENSVGVEEKELE